MRKTTLSIALVGALALPSYASAQISAGASASFHLDLPTVLPPVVVVQPGVQVIPEISHEVFLVGGVYWTRHDGGWYRAPNPRSGWVVAPVHAVPASLVKIPPGHYKNWKPEKKEKQKSKKAFKHGGWDGGGNGKKHGKH